MIRTPRIFKVKNIFFYKSWVDMEDSLGDDYYGDITRAWKESDFYIDSRDLFDAYIIFPKGTYIIIDNEDHEYFYGCLSDKNGYPLGPNTCELRVSFSKNTWDTTTSKYLKEISLKNII